MLSTTLSMSVYFLLLSYPDIFPQNKFRTYYPPTDNSDTEEEEVFPEAPEDEGDFLELISVALEEAVKEKKAEEEAIKTPGEEEEEKEDEKKKAPKRKRGGKKGKASKKRHVSLRPFTTPVTRYAPKEGPISGDLLVSNEEFAALRFPK